MGYYDYYYYWRRGPFLICTIFVIFVHFHCSLCTVQKSPITTNLVYDDSTEVDLEDDLERQKTLKYHQKLPYNGWSAWSQWSTCSRSCDTGIRYKLRRCLGGKCQGKSKHVELCNINAPCPAGSQDFRTYQCAQQNGKLYRNILFDEWTPVESGREPCVLSCRSKTFGFIVKFQSKVVDGTRCFNNSRNVCIDGACVNVGCDNVLESKLTLDDCGVCGGDGGSCGRRKYKWKDTYQFSSCDKTCGSNSHRVSALICINTKTDRQVRDDYCINDEKPRARIEECPHIPCPAKVKELKLQSTPALASNKANSENETAKIYKCLITVAAVISLFWAVCPLAGWASFNVTPPGISCTIDWMRNDESYVTYNVTYTIFGYILPGVINMWYTVELWRQLGGINQEVVVSWAPSRRLSRPVAVCCAWATFVAFAGYGYVCFYAVVADPTSLSSQANLLPPPMAKAAGPLNAVLFVCCNRAIWAGIRKLFGFSYDANALKPPAGHRSKTAAAYRKDSTEQCPLEEARQL